MAVVHTSLIYEAHQQLFSSLPCWQGNAGSERRVFEAWMYVCTTRYCRSILNAQITLRCIKNSQRQTCQPNSQSDYTKFSGNFDNEVYIDRMRSMYKGYIFVSCSYCLAYDRFAAPQIRPAIKHSGHSIPSQVFS